MAIPAAIRIELLVTRLKPILELTNERIPFGSQNHCWHWRYPLHLLQWLPQGSQPKGHQAANQSCAAAQASRDDGRAWRSQSSRLSARSQVDVGTHATPNRIQWRIPLGLL